LRRERGTGAGVLELWVSWWDVGVVSEALLALPSYGTVILLL
jgi:hypothetical protein